MVKIEGCDRYFLNYFFSRCYKLMDGTNIQKIINKFTL